MKRKTLLLSIMIILVVLELFLIFLMYKSYQNKPLIELDDVQIKDYSSETTFNYFLEQNYGLQDYQKLAQNIWPTEGFQYNPYKSNCLDDSHNILTNALLYDEVNDLVTLEVKNAKVCNLYFDKVNQIKMP